MIFKDDGTDLSQQFFHLSNMLLNSSKLIINNTVCLIREVEIYYNESQKHPSRSYTHPDPFVHCDKEQLTNGMWYFHRQNGGKYKGGSFKGLDITIGCNKRTKTYGGVLIRSIQIGSLVVEGSCNIVNKILHKTNRKIYLIPHVCFGPTYNDDYLFLKNVLSIIGNQGNRVVLVPPIYNAS